MCLLPLGRTRLTVVRPFFPNRRRMMRGFAAFFLVPSEDHFARRRLEDARDGRFDGLADHLTGIIDHDHRAVIEIGDTLIEFLALFQDEHLHRFARQINRLERIGEFIDVQNLDTAELRHLIQVEVVRNDLRVELFGEFDQLHVHFTQRRIVVFHELDRDPGHLLDPLKNVEATAATIAFQRVSRVRHLLKFTQNEVRNDQDAIQESCFADICNPSIDDDAGIENLVCLLRWPLTAENSAKGRKIQQVALVRAYNQPNVRH